MPTTGGRYSNCVQDQRPLDNRTDVLRYQTPPLDAALDVTGEAKATLWVSSDAVSTDFNAKLIDVYPDGYALLVTDAQTRVRLKPGEPKKVEIRLPPTSNLFARGHRIRIDISSSNYPQFEPNPGTGEPPLSWTRRVKARNTVYQDGRRASYVELPVAPAALSVSRKPATER